jgi:hypothetical protein
VLAGLLGGGPKLPNPGIISESNHSGIITPISYRDLYCFVNPVPGLLRLYGQDRILCTLHKSSNAKKRKFYIFVFDKNEITV